MLVNKEKKNEPFYAILNNKNLIVMKKIIVLGFIILATQFLNANPIILPGLALSELKFNDNNNWIIELQYFYVTENMPIDSIWIQSVSGIAKLKHFQMNGDRGILLVENDSLNSNLTINPVNDSIQIIYTINGSSTHGFEPLTFGYANGMVKSPKTGQSIAATDIDYACSYSLDNSPTIGAYNDTIGMCGTIRGHIYDKNNQLLTRADAGFGYNGIAKVFSPNSDGSYSTRIFSRNNHIKWLYYCKIPLIGGFNSVYTQPLDISIVPDTVVDIDIYLTSSLILGLDPAHINEESLIRIFPNPIKELSFNYEIDIPVKSANSYIVVTDITGKAILESYITENKGIINLPEQIVSGNYVVSLFVNNKNYSNTKILINRE